MAHSPIWESGKAWEVFSGRKRGIGERLEHIQALKTQNRTSFETERCDWDGRERPAGRPSQGGVATAAIESKNNAFCCLRIKIKFCISRIR